jgi:hypothetical protein
MSRLSLSLLGVVEEGQPISSEQAADMKRLLGILLHSYQAMGLRLWKATRRTIDMVASTASYSLGQGTHDIVADEILIREDGIDTRISMLTREQYMGLPNKSTTGKPTSVYFDRDTENSSGGGTWAGGLTAYPWPVPDSSDYDLVLTCMMRVDDASSTSVDIDAPTRWYEAILYGLAYMASFQHKVPPDRRGALKAERDRSLEVARRDDSERGGVRIAPRMWSY